ncbi:unnamed protein product [Heligmosomoides polygyrus]|uniref:Peptidase A2 domain-containing protein n=1 Tax=Heligmosomoides polygyrus TaxID=6339 RepID=A0A3P8EUL8_HELPZ|nr:unnamed protein product [Heligmosomoides polygyrus]
MKIWLARTTAQVQLLGMTRTALMDTGSQVSIIPLQMLVDALQNGYDLNADVEEIDLDWNKAVYDASGNPMSFNGAIKLTIQVSKGPRHRIGLYVTAGGDDVIVLGTNALKKLGLSLTPNAQPSRGRTEASSGRRGQHREAKAKEAAVQQRKANASEVVRVARRICLKPEETKDVSLCCDDMKQDGVLLSSGEILPDTEGQGAQHHIQVPATNSFAGAKMFREGKVVSTCEGAEMAERVVRKARAPKPTATICGRRTVFSHLRRECGVHLAELGIPQASEESKKKAPAATRIPQPHLAHTQRKRVIKKEPVGRSTLDKENSQLSLSKVDGDEVDSVKTAMSEVWADLTRKLSALERRLEAAVCCHYLEVVGRHKATTSHGKEGRPGRNERRMRTPMVTARISCSFEAASKELKKRRRQQKAARARRRRGEYCPSLSVMPDQERPRRETTSVEQHPCGVVQAHGALENPRKRRTSNGRKDHYDDHARVRNGPRAHRRSRERDRRNALLWSKKTVWMREPAAHNALLPPGPMWSVGIMIAASPLGCAERV